MLDLIHDMPEFTDPKLTKSEFSESELAESRLTRSKHTRPKLAISKLAWLERGFAILGLLFFSLRLEFRPSCQAESCLFGATRFGAWQFYCYCRATNMPSTPPPETLGFGPW